jgi:ABC-type ATPase involved in cell division
VAKQSKHMMSKSLLNQLNQLKKKWEKEKIWHFNKKYACYTHTHSIIVRRRVECVYQNDRLYTTTTIITI